MKVVPLFGSWGPWQSQVCRDMAASAPGVMFLSELLVAGDQKASLASPSRELRPFRHLEGSLAWVPSLLFSVSGTYMGPLAGVLLCRLAGQALNGAPWVGSYPVFGTSVT